MVSVIIPAYNVAPYLNRCVDSVLNQSYKDIEVILVNDGSTDSTRELCDILATTDERVRVIHKKNGGLSSARNTGIEEARGEYLMFVDSDDWLHHDCIKCLFDDVQTYGVKLAMGGHVRTKNKLNDIPIESNCEVIDQSLAIPRMLHGEWISAWAKLYHRSLWDQVRFPEGLNNEDYAILIRIFERSGTVTYRKDVVYYYCIHEGSICRSILNPHTFDELKTGQMVWGYCKDRFPQWANIALFNLTASIIKLSGQCLLTGQYMDKYKEMEDIFWSNKKQILSNPELSLRYKPFLWTMAMGKGVHRLFVKCYDKYAGRK